MGKDATPTKLKPNQSTATAKFLRVPPRKARLVIDAVRGKYVSDALAILKFVPNFAARTIEEVIKSAMANAESGRPNDPATGKPLDPLVVENLKLVRAMVNEGPRMKRVQPRAQGRMYRILKRMCHITVILEEAEPKPRPQKKRAATRRHRAAEARPQPAAEERTAAVVTAEEAAEVSEPEAIVTGEVETPEVTEAEAEAGLAGEIEAEAEEVAGAELTEIEAVDAAEITEEGQTGSAEAESVESAEETESAQEETDAAEDAPGGDKKDE